MALHPNGRGVHERSELLRDASVSVPPGAPTWGYRAPRLPTRPSHVSKRSGRLATRWGRNPTGWTDRVGHRVAEDFFSALDRHPRRRSRRRQRCGPAGANLRPWLDDMATSERTTLRSEKLAIPADDERSARTGSTDRRGPHGPADGPRLDLPGAPRAAPISGDEFTRSLWWAKWWLHALAPLPAGSARPASIRSRKKAVSTSPPRAHLDRCARAPNALTPITMLLQSVERKARSDQFDVDASFGPANRSSARPDDLRPVGSHAPARAGWC